MNTGRRRRDKTTADLAVDLEGRAKISVRSRVAYGLVKAAVDEAVRSIAANRPQPAAERRRPRTCALGSIQAGALATLELLDAVDAGVFA